MKKQKLKNSVLLLLTVFSGTAFFACLQLLLKNGGKAIIAGFSFTGMILSGILLYLCVKKLYKRFISGKLFKAFSDRLKRLFDYLRRVVKSMSEKLGTRRKRVFIKGKDKREFVLAELIRQSREERKRKRKKAPRLPKWSELETNRQRVRYIYAVFLLRQSKRGVSINPAMTPSDIAEGLAEEADKSGLFEHYNEVRYTDEKVPVSGKVVKELLLIIKKDKKRG